MFIFEPRRQRVIVRLPEDRGYVDVTPARDPYDQPRVIAVYNSPPTTTVPPVSVMTAPKTLEPKKNATKTVEEEPKQDKKTNTA